MNGSGRQEIWQRLLGLESHDTVKIRFKRIHARKLSARRAGEINATARQAREYFRNANAADYSVRPLLTFYGIACLGRALTLLMKPNGGEEGLTSGHGLESLGWRNLMGGSIDAGLQNLYNLKIRRRTGLFSDFLIHTRNTTLLHQRSSAVNGHCPYGKPDLEAEILLGDLFSRTPDLSPDYASVGVPQYVSVSEFSFNAKKGLEMKLTGDRASDIARAYQDVGYAVSVDDTRVLITCESSTVLKEPPMFVHAYMQNTMRPIPIPDLHLAVPFDGGVRFSQLCIIYMMSYILGMLVRYFPTHWIALINGGKGDLLWPTINRAQQYVENTFPELVAEYVTFSMDNPAEVGKDPAKECPSKRDANGHCAEDTAKSCLGSNAGSQ